MVRYLGMGYLGLADHTYSKVMRSAAVLVLACVGTAAAASWHLLDSDISTVDTGMFILCSTL